MKDTHKLLAAFVACILLGVGIGLIYVKYQNTLAQWFLPKPHVYETSDSALASRLETNRPVDVQWSQLLPANEKSVLEKYQQKQASTPTEFADNILLSLEATSDDDYSAAMVSTNSVDTFDNQSVSIAGFIVPIDYNKDKSLSNIFIVPYFGACLHFPPPPPNQIIFSQLGQGFSDFEITQAYRLNGVLRRGLFEDPLGTSAYILDVVSIEPYYEDPDDFRQH
ncbi:DUF3299 domain-containing protein [Ningiella sp. W23]|uniref:DUF3299 domain-containing protein n=1 Tax=Ningiella sp. W23 TaxID=3023715 RepID=UPI003756EB3A